MNTIAVALAHDVLAARAGGERVAVALMRAFPDAPLHTLFYEPDATFDSMPERRIEPSLLNRLAWLRRNYRHALPIAALTFAARKIDARVTICSTSGLSHHVRTSGAKIVYCHTPARWLHDSDNYLGGYSRAVRSCARVARPALARLDRAAMQRADRVLANSTQTAADIARVYDVEARVVRPCSTLDLHGAVDPVPGLMPGFVLSPARPLGYKRLDVLVNAARLLPDRQFVQIGDGPHRRALIESAPPNLVSLGAISEAQLRWAYRAATLVALTCAEDFGLVPLEAAAHGLHTVAPGARGLLDHRSDMLTTYTFGDPHALADAINLAPEPTHNLAPARLESERFIAEIRAVVASCQ